MGGSESVFINGRRALRMGDFAIGSGGPNRIESGCTDVFIGSPAPTEGLASAKSLSAFCQGYCALKKDWPKMTPKQRAARTKSLLADTFRSFGAPPPVVRTDAPEGAAAGFCAADWSVMFPPGAFDKNEPPDGDAVLHEARHGEQQFAPMREGAGEGKSASDMSDESGAPAYVAQQAARDPLPTDSAYGRWAQTMGSENMTAAGKKNQSQVINDYYAAVKKYGAGTPGALEAYEPYMKLPNGQDAHEIEDLGNCGGCP